MDSEFEDKKFKTSDKKIKLYVLVGCLFVVAVGGSTHYRTHLIGYYIKTSINASSSTNITTHDLNKTDQNHQHIFKNSFNLERRSQCNYARKKDCYSTNKSLVVSFWRSTSIDKWLANKILDAFPIHSFTHMIMIHDNSTWYKHPAYKHFIWIHVEGQIRYWYIKRFVSPVIMNSYKYLWILDDDAELTFTPLHYQCILDQLNISLSSPGRLKGPKSHRITITDTTFVNRIGRWTDFVETGPVVVISSFAWQCLYDYLDPSMGSGWGLDLVWCKILSNKCVPTSQHRPACAILDAFGVHHQSKAMNNIPHGGQEMSMYRKTYASFFSSFRNFGSLANDSHLIRFCKN